MDSILHPPPLHSLSLASPPPPFPFSFPFPIRNQSLTPNSKQLRNHNPISRASITLPSKPTPKQQQQLDDDVLAPPPKCLLRQALFCLAVGVTAIGAFRAPRPAAAAIALPAAVKDFVSAKKKRAGKEKAKTTHEYADCTEKLLETVSVLLRSVEGVRNGKGDMDEVEEALKAVKEKKEEMRGEINGRLYPQLRVLRRQKGALAKRAGQIIDEILAAKGEYDKLRRKEKKKGLEEKEKARVKAIEVKVGELEDEYNEIWEKIGDFEDAISREETVALSYGVREINFIEWECVQMVERFKQEMRHKETERFYLNAFI